MGRSFGPEMHTRSLIQPEPSLFLLLLWNLQPFTPQYPFNAFVLSLQNALQSPAEQRCHVPACVVQQASDHPISVAPVLIGQLDDVVGQPLFIGTASRCLALRGSMLAKRAAGAALGHAQFLPHMVNTFPAT